MERYTDLRNKEVIDVDEGKRLGYVCDVEIDTSCGKIIAIVVPLSSGFLGMFGKSEELVIGWADIRKIGDDIILVDISKRIHCD